MKVNAATLAALLYALSGALAAAQTQRALLIGVNSYQPEGTQALHPAGCTYGRCELGRFENLDGAVNDAQAARSARQHPHLHSPYRRQGA